MHVLEHQQDGAGRGQLGQHAEHGAEELLLDQAGYVAADRLALVPVGKQPGEHGPRRERVEQRPAGGRPGGGVAERIGQRKVRHGVAEFGAAAGQDGEASLAGTRGELGDQAGLAHASVTADQGDDGPAGRRRLEHAEQMAELGLPAD